MSLLLRFLVFIFLLFVVDPRPATGSEPKVMRDLVYARVDGLGLALDLYVPDAAPERALVVWVHGGAWRSGSRKEMPLAELIAAGYPVASVDYRLSPVAPFPAQIHDLKAALRFLRARGSEFGVSARRIVVAGASAGGHLAALVGVTNGNRDLEGEVGEHRDQSSSVQAIISFYGGANLTTILAQSTPHGLNVRVPALELLLGGRPDAKPELARLASPVFHVDKTDPPLLLFHGDQDPQMPVNQALELQGAYEAHGGKVRLEVLRGAGHGGKEFYDAKRIAVVKRFLAETFPQ